MILYLHLLPKGGSITPCRRQARLRLPPLSLDVIHRGRAHPRRSLGRTSPASAFLPHLLDPLGPRRCRGLCARHPGLRVVSVRQRTRREAVNKASPSRQGTSSVMWSDMAPPCRPCPLPSLSAEGAQVVCVVPSQDPTAKSCFMAIPALQGRSALRYIRGAGRKARRASSPGLCRLQRKDRFSALGRIVRHPGAGWVGGGGAGSLRCHLWGELIRHDAANQADYHSSPTPEDTSAGPDTPLLLMNWQSGSWRFGEPPLGRFLRGWPLRA
jgi:hypothetical protein